MRMMLKTGDNMNRIRARVGDCLIEGWRNEQVLALLIGPRASHGKMRLVHRAIDRRHWSSTKVVVSLWSEVGWWMENGGCLGRVY